MDLEHLLAVARHAHNNGITAMSTGEAIAAALVLNRSDWLASMGYTIAQAIDRVDEDAIPRIPVAARMMAATDAVIGQAQAAAREESSMSELGKEAVQVDVNARLVTYGNAPRYRDVDLIFDVQRFDSPKTHRLRLHVNKDDSLSILAHIIDVNRTAWDGHKPIDGKGEERPRWVERLYPTAGQ